MPSLEIAQAWYPNNDPVHGFDHVLRVYRMAERLARAEGADLEIVLTAVLLHDALPPEQAFSQPVSDSLTQSDSPLENEMRQMHHHTSAEFAGVTLSAEGWSAERIAAVQHAIRAHRFRDRSEPPASLEAQVLFDADKLDAIGAIGVARAIAYAARAGEPAYAPVSDIFLRSGEKAPGDPQKLWRRILDPYRESLRCATALTIPSNTADVRRGLLMLTKTSVL